MIAYLRESTCPSFRKKYYYLVIKKKIKENKNLFMSLMLIAVCLKSLHEKRTHVLPITLSVTYRLYFCFAEIWHSYTPEWSGLTGSKMRSDDVRSASWLVLWSTNRASSCTHFTSPMAIKWSWSIRFHVTWSRWETAWVQCHVTALIFTHTYGCHVHNM